MVPPKLALCFVLLLCTSVPVCGMAAEVSYHVATGVTYTDYREYDQDNNQLDREHGYLPGIELGLALHWQRWFLKAKASGFAESIRYDGQTQRGAIHQTHTKTRFFTLGLQLGAWFDQPQTWGTFVHLAGQQWRRDIQPNGNVQGILERYRWLEIGAGVLHRWPAWSSAKWQQQTQFTAFATTQGHLVVYLSRLQGQMPNIVLHPHSSFGLRLSHQLSWALNDHYQLFIKPQLAWWHFRAANAVTVSDGLNRYAIGEPRSTTWRAGLKVGLLF